MAASSTEFSRGAAAGRRRILITGAAGNLGRKIAAHLSAAGHDLVLLDRVAMGSGALVADLGADTAWRDAFKDVGCVIHLAAVSGEEASEEDCLHSNVDATRAVIDASLVHGVRRLVFASSSWVMRGYEGSGIAIREELPALPQTPYGRSKAWCEEELKRLPSAVSLRIGWVQPENEKSRALLAPHQLRSLWLSDGDLCRAVECAVLAPDIGYAVCNVTSRNAGSNWPLDRAWEVLRYRPRDGIGRIDMLRARLCQRFRKFFNLPR